MIQFTYHNYGNEDYVGLLPEFLDVADPRSAIEQLDANYQHGGGWSPMQKFVLTAVGHPSRWYLKYPGDPKLSCLATAEIHGQTVAVFDNSWVAVVREDGSYQVARMD